MQGELKSYVPRYIRMGSHDEPVCSFNLDSVEEIPVIDNDGAVIEKYYNKKSVPASECYSKYKLADFKLQTLLENGVKLSVVNIDRGQLHNIEELSRITSKLDDLSEYADFVEQQRKELDEMFVESSKNVES